MLIKCPYCGSKNHFKKRSYKSVKGWVVLESQKYPKKCPKCKRMFYVVYNIKTEKAKIIKAKRRSKRVVPCLWSGGQLGFE